MSCSDRRAELALHLEDHGQVAERLSPAAPRVAVHRLVPQHVVAHLQYSIIACWPDILRPGDICHHRYAGPCVMSRLQKKVSDIRASIASAQSSSGHPADMCCRLYTISVSRRGNRTPSRTFSMSKTSRRHTEVMTRPMRFSRYSAATTATESTHRNYSRTNSATCKCKCADMNCAESGCCSGTPRHFPHLRPQGGSWRRRPSHWSPCPASSASARHKPWQHWPAHKNCMACFSGVQVSE
jgi:hypothetical protein